MNNRCDYLIIGGGIAGTTAAETIRTVDPSGAIAIVADEPHPLYSRVLLPRYVKGVIGREQLFLRSLADYETKAISLILGHEAARFDPAARTLAMKDGRVMTFGKLLIAAGGRPKPLGIPGEALPGVSRFQTIEDADRMVPLVSSAHQAVVIGGGFIALEYLEILVRRSIPTTLLLSGPHVFDRFFDQAGGRLIGECLRRHGVAVRAGETAVRIEGEERVTGVRTGRGEVIACDFVGVGVGLDRNTAWLRSSGLELAAQGVATDEFLGTSAAGIFAAGDVAYCRDAVNGIRRSHGNWGNAFLQGQVAGRNMVNPDAPESYRAVTGYSIKSLDMVITLVGAPAARDGVETVNRIESEKPRYARFFLKGERLVGAAMINQPEDQRSIAVLIRDAVPLGEGRDHLADPGFDIGRLIP